MDRYTNTEILIRIKNIILKLLGTDGINSLGKLQVINKNQVVQEIPAIEIQYTNSPKMLTTKMVENSGVRVTIFENPDIVPESYHHGNSLFTDYYHIAIDSYHPTNGLRDSIKELVACPFLRIDSNIPIHQGEIGKEGAKPARALLYVKRVTFTDCDR